MSEQDITSTEATKHPPSDNDVFSETVRSMLEPRFSSNVASERVDYSSAPITRGERLCDGNT